MVSARAGMMGVGEFVEASGTWANDRIPGVQFKASFLKATPPTTVEGIERRRRPASAIDRRARRYRTHDRGPAGGLGIPRYIREDQHLSPATGSAYSGSQLSFLP